MSVEFLPTKIPPGRDKVEVLRQRVEAGLPLWHPDDDLSKPSPLATLSGRATKDRVKVRYALIDLPSMEVIMTTADEAAALAVHVEGETVLACSDRGSQDAVGKALREAARQKGLI